MKAYAPAINNRSQGSWKKTGTVNVDKFTRPLDIPNANTGAIYMSQPEENVEKIGVYNSGDFVSTNGTYTTDVSNSNYVGILNPYTYNMTGNRTQTAMAKSFSSLEMVFIGIKRKL